MSLQTREQELKKFYLERLYEAGYNTVPKLVQVLPPTIMNIIQSDIITAEKLFVAALKSHMTLIYKEFNGDPPEGINKPLNDIGYMTIQEIADANPTIIAKSLKINLENAGDIVLHAMELSVSQYESISKTGKEMFDDLDKEISHYLGQLDRLEKEQKLKTIVEETVLKIYDTIKMPSEEIKITQNQKEEILAIINQFMTVFPACTGFALYNKRGEGVLNISNDKQAKKTLTNIHDSIPSLFWKISLVLEEKDEYGWINAHPHIVWIETVRNRSLKRQLAYIGLFLFEASAKEGVGTATPTIKGISKEIERIIYGGVIKR
ncbi:MAG TPA: hypothetical protein VMX55_04765 [candidate division Zixibacteria bacterium]|nr:hypothetical protein [candidate division Zixibacteria bacterium]